jgi:hypothetical protein
LGYCMQGALTSLIFDDRQRASHDMICDDCVQFDMQIV